MKPCFDHEKLHVYQRALEFTVWVETVLELLPKSSAAYQQLDRASVSIPLNIAEGTGKFTASDKCRFYDIARGSAVECAACLDVLAGKQRIPSEMAARGKQMLLEVVSMLIGLIKAVTPQRVGEEPGAYDARPRDGECQVG